MQAKDKIRHDVIQEAIRDILHNLPEGVEIRAYWPIDKDHPIVELTHLYPLSKIIYTPKNYGDWT